MEPNPIKASVQAMGPLADSYQAVAQRITALQERVTVLERALERIEDIADDSTWSGDATRKLARKALDGAPGGS